MDLVELTKFLVESVIPDSDLISIKQFEDEEYITIEILADASIMGNIIGKKGNMINAIRTIVQASSYANGLKKVKVNVDSF